MFDGKYLYLCLCFLQKNKHGKFVVEQGIREIFGLKTERTAGGLTKLYSEQLHDLYW